MWYSDMYVFNCPLPGTDIFNRVLNLKLEKLLSSLPSESVSSMTSTSSGSVATPSSGSAGLMPSSGSVRQTVVNTSVGVTPRYTFKGDGERAVLSFELPGVKPESVQVHTCSNNVVELTFVDIAGKTVNKLYTVNEFYDVSQCQATLQHGLLQLTCPRAKLYQKNARVPVELK